MMTRQKIKVMLVEDNPADARLLRAATAQTGSSHLELVHTTRLSEALPRLRRERFDVVLLDLGLPDSQSLETLQSVREAVPALPIVVMTGLNDEEVALEALQRGAQDYILKGTVDGALVVRAVRYAIERNRLSADLVENVARRKEAEAALRRAQTSHIWIALYRLLGEGASAVLYQAGVEAAPGTADFVRKEWAPADDAAFIQALGEHLASAGLCTSSEMTIDRASRRAVARVRGSFEASLGKQEEGKPACHFLRGLVAGIAGTHLGGAEIVCDEVACASQGREQCEFLIHPMFG
jgi:DNA-binding NarL/FixJ family response regulator